MKKTTQTGKAASTAKAATKKSTTKKAAVKPAAKKPAAKKPAAKKPATKKPVAKKPAAKKPATKKPATKKPAAKTSGAKKPAAKPAKKLAAKAPAKKLAAKAPAKMPVAKPAARPPARKPAATPAAARPGVPKVSPMKGSSLDDFISRLPAWQGEVTRTLLDLVTRIAPEAAAVIKWAQPVFEHNGPFAFIKPAGKHITFGFWRGTELDDPHALLQGTGDRMRHVKLGDLQDAGHPHLEEFVRQAIELNRAKGDPTRR